MLIPLFVYFEAQLIRFYCGGYWENIKGIQKIEEKQKKCVFKFIYLRTKSPLKPWKSLAFLSPLPVPSDSICVTFMLILSFKQKFTPVHKNRCVPEIVDYNKTFYKLNMVFFIYFLPKYKIFQESYNGKQTPCTILTLTHTQKIKNASEIKETEESSRTTIENIHGIASRSQNLFSSIHKFLPSSKMD